MLQNRKNEKNGIMNIDQAVKSQRKFSLNKGGNDAVMVFVF